MDGERHHHDNHNTNLPTTTTTTTTTTSSSVATSIHATALDGITNVNSLFTLAIFIGLAWNPSDATAVPTFCSASPSTAESMVSFHVYSFSSFLFSSLVAQCLKQAIRILQPPRDAHAMRVNREALRAGILASAAGSVAGCGFLTMALVDVVRIKLGKIGCGGKAAVAVLPLVTLIPAAMLAYIGIIFYAFTR